MKKLTQLFILALMMLSTSAFAGGRILSDTVKNGTRIVKYEPDDMICPSAMEIHLKGNIITFYKSFGGCSGNSKGVGALVKGMTVDEAISKLEGIPCGNRPTSCPDQLAQALKLIRKAKATK